MKATSGLSSGTFLPSSAADGGAAPPPPGEKSSSTFSDLLKNQEGGARAATSDWSSATAKPIPAPAVAPGAMPEIAGANPAPATTPALVAAAQSIPAPAATPEVVPAPLPTAPADESGNSASPRPAVSSYLASSLTQAAVLKANAGASDQNPTDPALGLASATVIAPAKDLPLFKLPPKALGTGTSEKKSASSGTEGSFIQAGTPINAGTWYTFALGQGQIASLAQNVADKSIASSPNSPLTPLDGASPDAASGAGMANGKREKDMSAILELPQPIVSTGTNPLVTKTPADVHILLGTNHDFKDALGQVMRIAEMSGMSKTTPPLRVAIEIQTPPGAVVNVYVSRQNDGYRAQLSANDPAALSWVQDQIGSLRQTTDSDVPVRWLPAQMETTSPAATTTPAASSGRDSGMAWDRGGQNQQGWRQSGEDRPAPRQKRVPLPVFATTRANPFLSPVGALGRAA